MTANEIKQELDKAARIRAVLPEYINQLGTADKADCLTDYNEIFNIKGGE